MKGVWKSHVFSEILFLIFMGKSAIGTVVQFLQVSLQCLDSHYKVLIILSIDL